MDPEFQRILGRVLLVGGTIGVVSAAALVVAFRAFAAKEGGGSELRAVALVAGVLAFVMLCSAVLLLFSIPHGR